MNNNGVIGLDSFSVRLRRELCILPFISAAGLAISLPFSSQRFGVNRASTDEGFGSALRRFDRTFSSRAMILASLRKRAVLRSLCC